MPIYEYVCDSCGSEFEVMQKFSDPELKNHDCGPKSKVRRKLSLTSFHLQGGGWYASGYGANGSSGKNGSGAKAEASTAKAETSSTKSEAGAPSKSASGVSAAGACSGSCACH